MDANDYKKQFLAFLVTAYPDGLPDDFNALLFSVEDGEFAFILDLDDYRAALDEVVPKSIPVVENLVKPQKRTQKKKRKASAKTPKLQFDKMLTPEDFKLLEGMKISLDDGKKD